MTIIPKPAALIVEDEVIVRMITAEILEARGMTVEEAGDAPEALAVLAERPDIRLLIVDIVMPNGIDGMELARAAAAQYPGLSILIVSGREEPLRADLPPHTRFLPKPYSKQGLNWAIDEVLTLG